MELITRAVYDAASQGQKKNSWLWVAAERLEREGSRKPTEDAKFDDMGEVRRPFLA